MCLMYPSFLRCILSTGDFHSIYIPWHFMTTHFSPTSRDAQSNLNPPLNRYPRGSLGAIDTISHHHKNRCVMFRIYVKIKHRVCT